MCGDHRIPVTSNRILLFNSIHSDAVITDFVISLFLNVATDEKTREIPIILFFRHVVNLQISVDPRGFP